MYCNKDFFTAWSSLYSNCEFEAISGSKSDWTAKFDIVPAHGVYERIYTNIRVFYFLSIYARQTVVDHKCSFWCSTAHGRPVNGADGARPPYHCPWITDLTFTTTQETSSVEKSCWRRKNLPSQSYFWFYWSHIGIWPPMDSFMKCTSPYQDLRSTEKFTTAVKTTFAVCSIAYQVNKPMRAAIA